MSFTDCTLVELRQLAKEKGIQNVSKLKKDELIKALNSESLTTEETSTNNNDTGYKLTNEGDEIVEGVLEVLPDEGKTIYQLQKMYISLLFK